MHILCVSFKLYLYNFNSRIYIQLVPKVSSLVSYSTQLFHSLSSSNNKLIEIKKSSSIIFLFLFPSFRTLSELKFQIWNLRSMRSNECHFFPPPLNFSPTKLGSKSTAQKHRSILARFYFAALYKPANARMECYCEPVNHQPRIEFQPWWSNKVDRASVFSLFGERYSRFQRVPSD